MTVLVKSKQLDKIQNVVGTSVHGDDTEWRVNCPSCDTQFHFTGYFNSQEIDTCKCGCRFRTVKIWIDEISFIQ